MEIERTCEVDVSGLVGVVKVTANDEGRYMCIFDKDTTADFLKEFKAYGFMVYTGDAQYGRSEYYPIHVNEHTKLTKTIMSNMWMQIKTAVQN